MKIINKLSVKLLIIYLIATFFLLVGSGILLQIQWDNFKNKAAIIAHKDLTISEIIAKYILTIGSKLLDVTNNNLHQLLVNDHYHYDSIQKTLINATSIFSLDNNFENYGILMVLDAQGNLIARSDGIKPEALNFQDRYYFQDLKRNPQKSFVVGPLFVARTTGKGIFHFAVPIKGLHDDLIGVLALQIYEDSISKTINIAIDDPTTSITALTENNEIVFSTLSTAKRPDSDYALILSNFFHQLKHDQHIKTGQYDDLILTLHESFSLGLKYVSTQSTHTLRTQFAAINSKFFLLILIGYLIFSYLMWLIFRQYVLAEKERVISNIDQLTQIPNRRAFDVQYEHLLKDSIRTHSDISVLFIDIDKFKDCNDKFGHENGDIVLKTLADVLKSCLRRPLDFCCRWGGEELIALLPNTNEHGAEIVAQKILAAVRDTPMVIKGYPPIRVTVSIGIASANFHFNQHFENNLVDRADQAMYRAKQAGRDRYSF